MILMIAAIVTQITFAATASRPEMVIRQVNAVSVESSWARQSDVCTITLPRNTITFDRYKVSDLFRRGDAVKVEMGINGQYRREFSGYITGVSADVPVTIHCEDEMWKLRQVPVNVSMKRGSTLPQLMEKLLGKDYAMDVLELELPAELLRFSQTTVGAVLAKLKEVTGLPSYYQDGRLIVGKVYSDNNSTHEVNLDKLPPNTQLTYKRGEDRKLKVKAVSTNNNGQEKLEVEVGDSDGEVRQLSYTDITDKPTLTKLAQRDLNSLKLDGYEGSIEGIVGLNAAHGDKVRLTSASYPDRDGTYYVDRRTVKMDDSPKFRVMLELGPKAV